MEEKDRTGSDRKVGDGTLSELLDFAEQYRRDRRLMRIAVAIAAVFHVVLFLVHFPEMAQEVRAGTQRERKIFVVQQPTFRPPEVQQQQQQILRPRQVRVPIPDPTPDEPEPVREIVPEEDVQVAAPDDAIFGVPDAPPAPQEAPIRVGFGQMKEPKKLVDTKPIYPETARLARLQGVVILEIIVDKQGSVRSWKVLRPLSLGLTEAAIEAVKRWKYEPPMYNGRPVEVLITVTMRFSLQ
jgi:periplasmic protein TonB